MNTLYLSPRAESEKATQASQQDTAGNTLDTYAKEDERDAFRFLLKPSVISGFLKRRFERRDQFTWIELGCGNGTNSRVLARGVRESLGIQTPIHIIFVDVFSKLLEAADTRTQQMSSQIGNLTWELVQLDLNDPEGLERFAKTFEAAADLCFSIKFFYNTPVKISAPIARALATVLKRDGLFATQFYVQPGLKHGLTTLARQARGLPTTQAVAWDVPWASLQLRRHGLRPIYEVTSKSLDEASGVNHFFKHSVERYFIKP